MPKFRGIAESTRSPMALDPCFVLFPLSQIDGPCAAFPDEPLPNEGNHAYGDHHAYVFIYPKSMWLEILTCRLIPERRINETDNKPKKGKRRRKQKKDQDSQNTR